MRLITFVFLLIGVSGVAQASTLPCNDPLRRSDVCYAMHHLRAQVNMLDAQRDLMQVDYEYLAAIGKSMQSLAMELLNNRFIDNPDHQEGLKGVALISGELLKSAESQNSNAFTYANLVRSRCVTCHAPSAPESGITWGDVFANDWDTIVAKCNKPGRNPYLCKSMNGMLTAYGYFLTAYNANRVDYAVAKKSADEIVRVLGELKKNKILHLPEELRASAERTARDISQLAADKDPGVIEKGLMLTSSCVKCHNVRDSRGGNHDVNGIVNLSAGPWRVSASR